ncbi:MAG TPA: thiamine-phosphate kinase [Candidatus Corynebacterium avicola]|uniref:Thiamine-monophosphate kinase n=1 Tax=Candidatus Corynebacterium avicola TaxID=2838527 RepID=A0A9D1RNG4_9CORY|nr:thiamine-phosphate kinase [Candidatus Corynebacterium avicola]
MTGERSGQLTVAEAGEAATIAAIRQAAPSEINGDDAAVLDPAPPNSRYIATTDVLVDGVHFRFDWSTPYEVGVKAVTQNFADIQAMGGRPAAVLLSLAAPGDLPLDTVRDIAAGIGSTAAPWAVELVGGDVVTSKQLVISITAIGSLSGPDAALTMGAAQPGHQVIASGVIGHSAAGESILRYFGSREAVPEDPVLQELVRRHCAPTLVVGRGAVARAAGVRAMTDNSDGLLKDLTTLARRSNVSIDLDGAALTPDAQLYYAAEVLGADPWKWILTGGEDHTLLATTDQEPPAGYRFLGMVGEGHNEDPSDANGEKSPDADATTRIGATPTVTVDGQIPAYTGGWDSMGPGGDCQ